MLRRVTLLILVSIASIFLLTVHVGKTNAHESGPPYLMVEGQYALGNPILSYAEPTTLALGADVASSSGYLVGDALTFNVDLELFPNPYESPSGSSDDHSDLPQPQFRWDFGDGSVPAAGTRVSHAYSAPGTYIVDLEVQYPEKQTEFESVNTVQVDILPSAGYERAKTKIIVNGSSVENPSRDIISVQPGRRVSFSAETIGTSPVSYAWDFGNGSGANGSTVTTRYARDDYFPVVLLRATDEHGLWTDTYALLELPLGSSNPIVQLWYRLVDFIAFLLP